MPIRDAGALETGAAGGETVSTAPSRLSWVCSACQETGEVDMPDAGNVGESIPLVMAAHAKAAPDCQVNGTRRISVNVVRGGGCGGCGKRGR